MFVKKLVLLGLLITSILGSLSGSAWARTGEADLFEIDLTLESCLFQGEKPYEDGPSLILELRRVDGSWRRVWGMAGSFNVSIPVGRVVSADIDDDTVDLKVSMKIGGDAWVPGGRAIYDVHLKREEDGKLTGSYDGTFRFVPVKGEATGRIRPPRKIQSGSKQAQRGEHPRVLFGKDRLKELRSRAKSSFGQAALKKVADTAAGLGMKYQITSDPRYAKAARREVEKHLDDMNNGSKMIRSRIWGWRHEQIALAYDMCYDAWEDSFRKKVEQYVVYTGNRIYHNHRLFHSEIGWHLASTYPGQIMYGSAIAGLAMWGEKGPAPSRPEASFTESNSDLTVAPAKDDSPKEGVPVVNFKSGQLPSKWIYVSGFKVGDDKGPLGKTGGPARTLPGLGDQVNYGGRKQTWRALQKSRKYYYRGQISITDAADRIFFTTSYFHTVIRNDKPRWVKLDTGYEAATVYLAGTELHSGDVVKLKAGLYPMMVVAPITETTPWGKHLMKPRLIEMEPNDAKVEVSHIRAVYQEELADWRFDLSEWKRTDGADQDIQKLFEIGRWHMYLLYRESVKDSGFVAGADSSLEGSSRYAGLYENVFGRRLSPYPDVSHVLPCMMFQHLYGDGKTLSQDINGSPAFWWDAYHEKRNITNEMFASLYPVVPKKYRQAALWGWHRHAGTGDPIEMLVTPGRPYDFSRYKTHGLYMFVNYPLGKDGKHPADEMPLTWASPGYGYYGFRSGWKGTDEFLTQVYAKSRTSGGGRDNAGTFRVVGLGQRWTHGAGEPGGYRFGENVVLMPGVNTVESGLARPTYYKAESDGSGVISMDMTELYQSVKTGKKGKKPELYERYGSIRNDSAFKDTGIKGLRSIGVDYSGSSGAPCLLVIVDRIDGAKGKETYWAWQLESQRTKAPRGEWAKGKKGMMTWQGKTFPYDVGAIVQTRTRTIDDSKLATVKDNTFTLERGDASLRGTVIAAGETNLEFAEKSVWTIGYKRGMSKTSSKAVFASAPRNAYFVIVTIQKGRAPKVHVDGKGLNAVVTVGKQTVRFDGKKVVFGK